MLHVIHSTSQPFSEYYRQADLSMLALKMVTARVLVDISGSFRFQIMMGLTLMLSPGEKGYTVPSVMSQVVTPNITCLSCIKAGLPA